MKKVKQLSCHRYLSLLYEEVSHQVTAAVIIVSWKLVEVCGGSAVEAASVEPAATDSGFIS